MSDEQVEYKPIIPTPENSMAPDYAKEPTQFERQGLVDSGAPTPKTYGGPADMDGGFGGLTRREAQATAGAVAAGVVGVLWAFTRNPGYDRKSDARAAGKVTINAEAVKDPKIQTAIADLKESRAALSELFDAFKKDKNAELSEGIAEFEITELRNNLNAITFAAFDEDTQILTDRLSRNIIQVLNSPTSVSYGLGSGSCLHALVRLANKDGSRDLLVLLDHARWYFPLRVHVVGCWHAEHETCFKFNTYMRV
jgi:hypothetical protein